jgi:hypothetical protein
LFGKVGIALNTIFFDRTGTKEEKQTIVDQITERQIAIHENKGEGINLHIFAEGMTSNNTHIMPFKRGVFSSLLPIKPIAIKYSSAVFSPAHDVMPMGVHFVVLLSQLTNQVECTELPIFAPNEYFYKTHLKPGQEKWEVFATAVREVISDAISLPTSEATSQDKNDCKVSYFGDKAKLD